MGGMSVISVVVISVMVMQCFAKQGVLEMDIGSARMWTSDAEKLGRNDGQFSFASYYSSHMVLQASPKQAVIWGYAPSGTQGQTVQVVVKPNNLKFTATVTENLMWAVKMDPVDAGGPYSIVALLGSANITLTDVLFGDVWVCSGQSNMQLQLKQIFNATEEILDAESYKDIRVFIVKDKTSEVPLADIPADGIQLQWTAPSVSSEFGAFSAVCWLYGKYLYQTLKKPLGLLETSWGGTPVEAWSSPDALQKCGLNSKPTEINMTIDERLLFALEGPGDNSVLWNGMVHPLLNMTIYGAIWYQGEANVNKNMNEYNCSFPAMIDDWRKKFRAASGTDSTFPFGFVQLAPRNPDYSVSTGFPDIRWHQTADYGYVPNHRMRNVFMAVAMDLPDFLAPMGPIHPRDKQDVAARLTLAGLAVAYKQNVSGQGPYPVHVVISVEEPYNYTQVEVQYSQKLEQRWLDGFEICCSFVTPPVCATGKSWWLPTTTMQAYDRGNVTESYASECSIDNLVGVSYAWKETPCPFKKCAIYGADNGLPMPPWRYYNEEFQKIQIGKGKYVVKLGAGP